MSSDVQNFYANKTIFISGATGFLGHLLLSKLLCSCPEIRCIYILMRDKSGKRELNQILKELFDDPVLQRAKEIHQDYETKVKPVRGDCTKVDLGISVTDREIIENEVEIIFHVAATVKFNAPLRQSALINVYALDYLLDIAKKMKKLKVFMHVSTAFSSCAQTKLIEEKFYDAPLKANELLSSIEHLDDSTLDRINPSLIKPHPNNYIFTKLIAEDLCREKGSGLPLCIFRPAIITSCYKEPLPGWINNTYGLAGIILGYFLGVMKVLLVDGTKRGSIVPGDYTANALILSAYFANAYWQQNSAEKSKLDIPIVNYSNCTTKFVPTWGICMNEFKRCEKKYPFYKMIFLPGSKMFGNLVIYRIFTIIFHDIPATICDSILITFNKKPRFRNMYQKVHEMLDLLSYFTTHEWVMPIHKIEEIWAKLSDKDREIFYCDLNDVDVKQYFDVVIHGVRLYVAKDGDDTMWKAMQKRKVLLILYYTVDVLLVLILLYFLTNRFSSIPFSYLFKWN